MLGGRGALVHVVLWLLCQADPLQAPKVRQGAIALSADLLVVRVRRALGIPDIAPAAAPATIPTSRRTALGHGESHPDGAGSNLPPGGRATAVVERAILAPSVTAPAPVVWRPVPPPAPALGCAAVDPALDLFQPRKPPYRSLERDRVLTSSRRYRSALLERSLRALSRLRERLRESLPIAMPRFRRTPEDLVAPFSVIGQHKVRVCSCVGLLARV